MQGWILETPAVYGHNRGRKCMVSKCLETSSSACFQNLVTVCLNVVFQNRFLMVIFWIAWICNWGKQLFKKKIVSEGRKLYLILCDGCYGDELNINFTLSKTLLRFWLETRGKAWCQLKWLKASIHGAKKGWGPKALSPPRCHVTDWSHNGDQGSMK